jgi:hypothetical protein
VAAGRGNQAVADLDAAAIGLALEPDPPDCLAVGQTGDPVVAERPLLSEPGGRSKEASYCPDVALKWKIVGPHIGRSRTPSHDTFGLCDIDRVQLQVGCSNVGHKGGESAPIVAEQLGPSRYQLQPIEGAAEKANTFEGRRQHSSKL